MLAVTNRGVSRVFAARRHPPPRILLLVLKHVVSVRGSRTLLANTCSAGFLALPLLGASTQKGEGGETSSAGCKEELHSGGREERSFSGNFAFSNLHILGFSINFPFVFSHRRGAGALLCTPPLEFAGVSEHTVGQVGPGVGLLGAG